MSIFHKHRYVEHVGGLYADQPNGPKTYHEVWWECSCGDVIDPQAKRRSEVAERLKPEWIKPGEWPLFELWHEYQENPNRVLCRDS